MRTWQQTERRALVADLVRTQATLQARSEQLQEIFASRWYRLARLFWRLRRGTIFRKSAPPRMAGEDSFVRPLDADMATDEPEVRLVPSPNSRLAAVDLERLRWLSGASMSGLEELRVAAILDEASEACLAPECDLDTGFGAANWRERLEADPPHMLLVESAWAGNGGGWTGAISPHPGSPQAGLPALRELVAWCRERGIPSAFWATRDPLSFAHFAAAASLFDHIFTVDADRIAAYRELPDSAAQTVATLPLAVQPRLHNPIGGDGRRPATLGFADAYDQTWPRESAKARDDLLEAGMAFGLSIYERDGEPPGTESNFPPRFSTMVEGRIAYGETAAAYRRHCLFLSASPSPSSPTALPRHVLELLACGTPVLSTPSAGVEEILGELVPIAGDREEATVQIERLLEDAGYRSSLAVLGQRHVLAEHTYRDRLAELVAAVGFDVGVGGSEETAVLLVASERQELGEATNSLLQQSLAPNEVLLGLAANTASEGYLDQLVERFPEARIRTISQEGQRHSSERLRELARLAAAPWVAPMTPPVRYGPHHLRDLVACTRFADAGAIGFASKSGETAHSYAETIPPHAALAKRDLVAARGWPSDETAMRRWFAEGVRVYAGDPLGGAAEGA